MEAVYQYLVPIILPVTNNMLFLNQQKLFFHERMFRIDHGTPACEALSLMFGLLLEYA